MITRSNRLVLAAFLAIAASALVSAVTGNLWYLLGVGTAVNVLVASWCRREKDRIQPRVREPVSSCPSSGLLSRFMQGLLGEDEHDTVWQHVRYCRDCSQAVLMMDEHSPARAEEKPRADFVGRSVSPAQAAGGLGDKQ